MMMLWKDLTHEEKVKFVQKQIKNRKSASEIASMFRGATRNAIIGFCHRSGLRLPGRQKDKPREGARRAPTRSRRDAIKIVVIARSTVAPAIQSDPPEDLPIDFLSPVEIETTTNTPVADQIDSPAEEEPIEVEEAVVEVGPVSMMKLTDKHCRWPLDHNYRGVPVDQMMFCGKSTMPGSRYCPECHKAGVESVTRRKSAKELRGQWQT
jgi:hypothetical protein